MGAPALVISLFFTRTSILITRDVSLFVTYLKRFKKNMNNHKLLDVSHILAFAYFIAFCYLLRVEACGKKYSPSQIGAYVLMKMKSTAEVSFFAFISGHSFD